MKQYMILLAMFGLVSPSLQSAGVACQNKTAVKVKAHSQPAPEQSTPETEAVLAKMKRATESLKTCQAKLKYLFIQDPELLGSETLRTGMLYYQKQSDHSKLRIRFNDVKQDDFETEEHRQDYLFDGVWLTQVDYKLKQIDRYQKAPEDKPIDVFDLIGHNFPLIGFSDIEQLSKDFDIQLSEDNPDPNHIVALLLTTQKGSRYDKEYKKVDFRVAKETYLPQQVIAHSSQGDIHDITFEQLTLNNELKKNVFDIETPAGFHENIERLKETPKKEQEPTD